MPVFRRNTQASPYRLPEAVSEPVSDLAAYSILLYGREKIGKTTFCAQFPDALFLMCEPGGKALSIYQVPIRTWAEFVGYLQELRRSTRFKTIVVDTVDLAFKYCEAWGCAKLGISHPSEEDWGKAYGLIRDEFARTMATLLKLGRGVILVSHAQEKEIKRRNGGTSTRIVPTMSNPARNVIEPMVDIWMYYDYDESRGRMARVVGDDMISAGHRTEHHFQGCEDGIPMGRSAAEAYAQFVSAFRNELAAPVPATRGVRVRRS